MTHHTSNMLTEALELAALGWRVFPLNGKQPATRHGFHDASDDYDVIDAWWTRMPDANIGIALPPGIIVLDIDPRHGGTAGLSALTREHGQLPETAVVITGRRDGGSHIYLNCPTERLTQARLPDGVDLRAGGKHYVVAPPSLHPDTGWEYEWFNPDVPIATAPRWVVDLLRQPIAPTAPSTRETTGATAAGLLDFVATLAPGNRNNGLYWAARSAYEDGLLDAMLVRDMISAAMACGLSEAEAMAVVRSASRGSV